MIDIINTKNDAILEVEFMGTFTKSDLEHLKPVVQKHVKEHTHPLLILSMHEFDGWDEAKTFFKDMQMDTKNINSFERTAVIGDKKWEEWVTKLFKPFASNNIKFFPQKKSTEARTWLTTG